MRLTAQIDSDIKSLERYFSRLFEVLGESVSENISAPVEVQDVDAIVSQATYHHFDHFIKPDMVINIYSLLEFWLREICNYQKRKNNLMIESKDIAKSIKGKNDLLVYKKYLIEYVGLNLTSVEDSYVNLEKLRRIRNAIIHNGGHIRNETERLSFQIDGISIYGSLIVIEERYIWNTLESARDFLFVAAQA